METAESTFQEPTGSPDCASEGRCASSGAPSPLAEETGSAPVLPHGYCFVETAETTLQEPTGSPDCASEGRCASSGAPSPLAEESGSAQVLPHGWVEMMSRSTGQLY